MGKATRLYEKWTESIPGDVRLQDAVTFMNHYFPGMWTQKRSSHIVIRCERLKIFAQYQPNGEITVPIKSGQKVKGVYLKELVKAVRLLEELGDAQ